METTTITPAELAAASTPETPANPTPSTPPPASPPPGPAAEVDSLNRPFDAEKFAPRKDSQGRWINRNAGRKPKSAAASLDSGRSFVPDEPSAPTAPLAALPDIYDAAAEMYCRLFYGLAEMTLGGSGEWQPKDDAEHQTLKKPLSDYLREVGTVELPKWMTLALAAGIYAGPRLALPNSRARLAAIWCFLTGQPNRAELDATPPAPEKPAAPTLSPQAAAQAETARAHEESKIAS